jgi:hypothetical protein
MKVTINPDAPAKQLTITITNVDWEQIQQGNFHAGEQVVQQLLSLSGRELTRQLLESKDCHEPTLEDGGQTWYRKQASAGHYQTLYGPVTVRRHTYQTGAGGQTRCPLEEACQLRFGTATPRLAEVLSFKLAALTPREVEQDLATAHNLALSASFIQQTAQQVGQLAAEKAERWQLRSQPPARKVFTVASGLDGTTLPLVGEDYKEAMCGTIALYDAAGKRLTTEYLGAMPETGKATFTRLFTTRVAEVLTRYPRALHVCLADGAAWNWQLIARHYPEAIWILDFYHAAQHLALAADLIFGTTPSTQKTDWYEHWRTALRDETEGVAGVIRSLIYYRNRRKFSAADARDLDTQINYFRTNADKMQYADYVAAGLPIGSGVTEAGCKELIKARFCRSGMRWKRETGTKILHLRAIRLSNQWESFWQKVMRYAA